MAKKAKRKSARRRPVQADDLLRFRLIGIPQISPVGRHIVFVVKRVGDKNEYVSNLWIVPTDGSQPPRQFTSGGKDGSPRWSADGSRIAFVSEREKHKPQIHVIHSSGGEATALTKLPEGAISSFRWSPDGKLIAVSFREQDPQWTEEAKKQREEKGLSTPARVIDDWWYRLDGDGYFNAQRHQLFLVDTQTGEHRLLYAKDTLGDVSFDFSPDSQQLVVSTNRDKKALIRPWKDELVRIDVAGGKVTPIPNLPKGPKAAVRWSPRGDLIAFAGREGTDGIYSVENLELWVCAPDGSDARSLTAGEDYCLLSVTISDATEAVFAPQHEFSADGSRVYMRIGSQGNTHVASVPVAGGKITMHTSGEGDIVPGNVSADGKKMALTIGSPTRLAEVAVADCKAGAFKTTMLGDLNGKLFGELDVASPESHWVTAEDGHRVHVWVLKPPGLKRGAKAPAILEIHGGPHAQYGCGYFHEFQVLAAAGYTVFFSNPRGSKGYGRDHCAAIRGNWGSADWLDIQAVTKFMQNQNYVDAKRMGVMGGSYGGYMTNWTIGHCHDFAAAITDRCVSNLVSMSGNSDWIIEPDQYFPGNFWDRPEDRWRQSPIAYLGNAKTPTLVIHSEGDLRCNVEQGEQVFAALKLLDVPTRFVRYPRETSHGMSRQGPPDLRIHRLNQIQTWWKEWLN